MSKVTIPMAAILNTQLKGVTVLNVYYELVANSLDAGAKNISIHIRRDDKDFTSGATIEVKDDGRGILESDLDKIVNAMNPSDAHHKGLGRFVAAKCFGVVSYSSVATDGVRRCFDIDTCSEGAFTLDDIKSDPVSISDAPGTVVTTGKLSETNSSKIKTKKDFLDPIYLKEKLMDHFLLKLKECGDVVITIKSEAEGVLFDEVKLSASDIVGFAEMVSSRKIGGDFIKILWDCRQSTGKGEFEIQAIVDGRGAKLERGISCAISSPANFRIRAFVQWPGLCVNSERGTALVDDESLHESFEKALKQMLKKIVQQAVPGLRKEKENILRAVNEHHPELADLVLPEDDFFTIKEATAVARERYNERKDRVAGFRQAGAEVPPDQTDDLQRRALADYVQHRHDVIAVLRRLVNEGCDESTIHDLFLPRGIIADERSALCTNMWLLDDKYMSFLSLYSDMPSGVALSRSGVSSDAKDVKYGKKEPDLLLLYKSAAGTDGLIIELKKPLAKSDENHHLSKQLVTGERTLRQALGDEAQLDMIGIATIDSETADVLTDLNYHRLFEGRNDVFFSPVPGGRARKYIISYEKLLNDAESRNQTFLRVLREGFSPARLPTVSDLVAE